MSASTKPLNDMIEVSEEQLLSEMLPLDPVETNDPAKTPSNQSTNTESSKPELMPANQPAGDDLSTKSKPDIQSDNDQGDLAEETGGEEEAIEGTPEVQPQQPQVEPESKAEWKTDFERLQLQNELLQQEINALRQGRPTQPATPSHDISGVQGTGVPSIPESKPIDIFAGVESMTDDERSAVNQRVQQYIGQELSRMQENLWRTMPQFYLQMYEQVRLSEHLSEKLADVLPTIKPEQRSLFETQIAQLTNLVRQKEPALAGQALAAKVSAMYRLINNVPITPTSVNQPATTLSGTRPAVMKRQRVVPMDRPGARQLAAPPLTDEEKQLREFLPID